MSKKKIEEPKVFISYAWGSDEYQKKVLAFATRLMGDGINVIIDKWDLSEGNDTYAFMEKCANDSSITNVLILLDPIYAKKADAHSGGVGTETQIISPKVYKEVTQEKFVPVVFERNEKGEVCKPTYLEGRLHFDLSKDDTFELEYQRLVKFLYGEQIYPKPNLGTKPIWVEKRELIDVKKITSFDLIKSTQPEKAKTILFSNYLEGILKKIELKLQNVDYDNAISFYEEFRQIKIDYISLLRYCFYVEEPEEIIARKLEEITQKIQNIDNYQGGLAKNFIHELFLYTIAFFLKNEDFGAVGKILGRPYYNSNEYFNHVSGYEFFYSGRHDSLDRAMNIRDNKNYICGTATYWIETLNVDFITKEQFILADLICYNYSIYGKDVLTKWHWFPLTYLYDNEYKSVLEIMGSKLISKSYANKIAFLFGYDSADELKEKFKEVDMQIRERKLKGVRYQEVWHEAKILNDFIEIEKIATVH